MSYKFCVIIADRGDRPELLKHCLFQMDRQTVKPDTIYLIDYKPKTNECDIIPRIKEGIRKAKNAGFEYCYIIENDDYYPDDYFEKMQFKNYDFVGIKKTIYYGLQQKMFSNLSHGAQLRSSLFYTGFRISAIENYKWPDNDYISLDLDLWKFIRRKGNFHLYDLVDMPVGIKHNVGKCVTGAHSPKYKYEKSDKNLSWLRYHVRKESFDFYKSIINRLSGIKILVANHHLEKLGGSETFTYTIIGEFTRLGYEIDLFTFKPGIVSDKIKQDFGVNINIADSYDLILASHKSTVDHLRGRGFIVQTCHGIYPTLEQPSKNADFHIAISKEVQNHLSRLGYDSEIIWNGIDCQRFKPNGKSNEKLKTILSLSKSIKGNEIIKQACQKSNIDFISKRNEWNIEKDINNADLIISIGRGVYESMACGKPVIVFDHRNYSKNYGEGIVTEENIHQLMENNCSGRYSKKKFDSNSLIEEFDKYDSDISDFLRDYAVENLNIQNQVKKYLEIYEN